MTNWLLRDLNCCRIEHTVIRKKGLLIHRLHLKKTTYLAMSHRSHKCQQAYKNVPHRISPSICLAGRAYYSEVKECQTVWVVHISTPLFTLIG